MTRLRPVVVPVAALALATAAPSAVAQPRRQVWQRADSPSAHVLAAQHADLPATAGLVQPATSLPVGDLTPASAVAAPDDRYASAPPPAGAGAAGRPTVPTARGPPN